jgi:hypothetical protein
MSIRNFLHTINVQDAYIESETEASWYQKCCSRFHIKHLPEHDYYNVTVDIYDLTYSASRPTALGAYRQALHQASKGLKKLRGEQGAEIERFIVERQLEAHDE